MAKGRKTGGRVKGKPNTATANAREAIAQFVDGNAHRLQGWLDAIADGVKGTDKDGNETYLIQPKPQTAFELFQSIVEYHVPKLQRTDINANIHAKTEALVQVGFVGAAKDDERGS